MDLAATIAEIDSANANEAPEAKPQEVAVEAPAQEAKAEPEASPEGAQPEAKEEPEQPAEVPLWKRNLQADPMELLRSKVGELESQIQRAAAPQQAQPQAQQVDYDTQKAVLRADLEAGRITGEQFLASHDRITREQIMADVRSDLQQQMQAQQAQQEVAGFVGRVKDAIKADPEIQQITAFLSAPHPAFGGRAPLDTVHPAIESMLRASEAPAPLLRALASDAQLMAEAQRDPLTAAFKLGRLTAAPKATVQPVKRPDAPPPNLPKPSEVAAGNTQVSKGIEDLSLKDIAKKFRF